MTLQRREKLLIGLLGASVLLFVWFRLIPSLRGDGDIARAFGGASPNRRAASKDLDIDVVELDQETLERGSAQYEIGRNPFDYQALPTPPPVSVARATPVPRAPVPSLPARPRPPRIDFAYLGSFGPPDRKIAVFSKDETIVNALQGEVLDQKFVVQTIGFESVEVAFVGFPDEPAVRLAAGGPS